MAEQHITGQREQAIQRLRSLFAMHRIPFGAPAHLGGLLLSIRENRHFAMDFWSLVSALIDSGSGTLGDAAVVEAVVESSTGVDTTSLPADERPGVDELRQLLAGVDVSRPVEMSNKAAQPVSPDGDDLAERRRSIGATLAKLEESTRELRAQLTQLDAQMAGQRPADRTVIGPRPAEVKVAEEQKSEPPSRWNRMSPFGEEQMPVPEIDDEPSQAGSPMAEAAPPRRAAALQQQVETPVVTAPPSPSATQHAAPAESAVTAESPVAVFDPRPAGTLGRRGLAIPDPDDDPRITAPFSRYGDEEEPSLLKRLVAPAVILVLLAAALVAARTGAGHAWLQRAVQSVRDAYHSATTQENEPPPPAVPAPPATTQAAPGEAAATPSAAASPPGAAPEPAAPPAEGLRSSDSPDNEASPQGKPVDAGVLRVPASTMAANLIASRVPAYPETARARGIEGSVIMDVVISPAGTVKHVRVIDGDSHLRAAAQSAVLRWRYKPYLLKGKPVEVATTVKLGFHRPR